MPPRLDRDLRNSRQLIEGHEVTDDEHLGVSRQRSRLIIITHICPCISS